MNSHGVNLGNVFPVEFSPESGCNVSDEVMLQQVKASIRRGFPQIQPHAPNPATAILICGGPSLRDSEKDLIQSIWAGGKVVTVNGTYQWALARNIRPSATVMLDAREFNKRFVEEEVLQCKYLLASQCHPATFDLCRDRDVYIWHACSTDAEYDELKSYYFERLFPVTIGTTVAIRAISLLRMLGFERIEIFGLDSCWLNEEHHAYKQHENDVDEKYDVWLRPQDSKGKYRDEMARKFVCSPWHVKQAYDFLDLVKDRGAQLQLKVHGPGLIATMINTGYQLSQGEEK